MSALPHKTEARTFTIGGRDIALDRFSHRGGRAILEPFVGRDATDVYIAWHARAAPERYSTPYARLVQEVTEAGLFQPSRWQRISLLGDLLLVMLGMGLVWQSPLGGVVLGLGLVRIQYTQHDIFHNQWETVTSSRRLGNLLGILSGVTAAWWKDADHNPHHINTNSYPDDPNDFLGTPAWLCLLLPLLPLYLAFRSVQEGRGMERALPILHLLILTTAGPLGVLVTTTAYALAWVPFQILHHPPLPSPREDWIESQLVNTQTIRGGRLFRWVMGGHDLQIEHHLFPRMPRHRLAEAAPIVQRWCADHGFPYNEITPQQGWRAFAAAWWARRVEVSGC